MPQLLILLFLLGILTAGNTQVTHPENGPSKKHALIYAFTNATIHVDAETTLENATLLVQNGKILSVGEEGEVPNGAVMHDLKGKHIYPSFIDLYSDYGIKKLERKKGDGTPQYETNKDGAFAWNEAIKPEVRGAELFTHDGKALKELLKSGIGSVLTHQQDGIMRGTSALVMLNDEKENQSLILPDAANQFSFQKGVSRQAYPSSLMGSIALIRQTYYDAKWYANYGEEEENLSLKRINENRQLPVIFEVRDKLSALRAAKIAQEFDLNMIIKGSGDEYQRIDELKEYGYPLIIPVVYPEPYDVRDPYDARYVETSDMLHWKWAPFNARLLYENELPFAFTATGLKKKADFIKNIRKAIESGLPENEALRALTQTPAELLGVYERVGSLEAGKFANFMITSTTVFEEENEMYEHWVRGKKTVLQNKDLLDTRGTYDVNVNDVIYEIEVTGKPEKLKAKTEVIRVTTERDTVFDDDGVILEVKEKPKKDTVETKVNIEFDGINIISLSFTPKDEHYTGTVRLTGKVNFKSGIWDGRGQIPDGTWIEWNAIRKKDNQEEKEKTALKDSTLKPLPPRYYPMMSFAWKDSLPEAKNYLITGATVWTNEIEGILDNTDVFISNGKIKEIGSNLSTSLDEKETSYIVIDGKGKHLTPGLIDEHSHIAISRGVNESGQSVTSEVSIADVVNSDDINIYRQLAGGTTAAQLLHGSANTIGGKSALIKHKWGFSPEEMKIKESDGFIKFALGENVKQSNWGEKQTVRFPQTRMGVEQTLYDAFLRAKAYEKEWEAYEMTLEKSKKFSLRKKEAPIPPRRDLELETLVEIMNQERFISCHSYVQSEINMLMHVGDSMGFTVNTFTHILEGYKLADKMREHGAGGSTFSDWWAYKFEVNDAIPHNAGMMHEQGVVTAINSDDAEMGRRLNQEAAKSVKYYGVSEEDALKFVTLHPAKLLHLDDRMGSIKVGKDADLVLWSNKPLSLYAKPEKTFIEGMVLFDIERDMEMREEFNKLRSELIEEIIQAIDNGASAKPVEKKKHRHYHCDDLDE